MTDADLGELERLHAEFVAADAALRDARSRPGFWASPTYHLQRAYEETADAYQHALLRHGPALVAEVRRLRASLPPAGESASDDDPRYRVVVEYRDGFGLATFRTPGCDGMSTGVHLLADTALAQMLAAEAWRGECDRLRAENDRLRARVAELEGPQIVDKTAAAGGTSGPYRVR